MNSSVSLSNEDSRSVQRIIFEKANFGAVPTFFRVEGDERLHPVQWTKHPHLIDIIFSDGSTSRVIATYDPDLERQVMQRMKERETATDSYDKTEPAVEVDDFISKLDIETNLDELRDVVAETLSGAVTPVDDGMAVAYTRPINKMTPEEAVALGLTQG